MISIRIRLTSFLLTSIHIAYSIAFHLIESYDDG